MCKNKNFPKVLIDDVTGDRYYSHYDQANEYFKGCRDQCWLIVSYNKCTSGFWVEFKQRKIKDEEYLLKYKEQVSRH